ncbi:flagellar hook-basal body complex protein FliE [Pseudomonas asuensis]|uniref:Flagellar hook-basal body complex protein FliE n=1 Tax=Pseudomonas asuensis TaxID=1825787 RepID=A0ABQ2GMV6_9PSED|nr:flagellar hook-basal body complex protein FliE [Pseudomonas asuensis]GGM03093.1 flagellar hook-basal body complex protein FliE [Pseudomonas asuensis]
MVQGVEFNRLMLEMRSMQTEAMARKPMASPVGVEAAAGVPSFPDLLGQAVRKVNETQKVSNDMAKAFELGQGGVDLTEVMIASQKASVSFQAMTQVRNKMVQAYQDIMQMPI